MSVPGLGRASVATVFTSERCSDVTWSSRRVRVRCVVVVLASARAGAGRGPGCWGQRSLRALRVTHTRSATLGGHAGPHSTHTRASRTHTALIHINLGTNRHQSCTHGHGQGPTRGRGRHRVRLQRPALRHLPGHPRHRPCSSSAMVARLRGHPEGVHKARLRCGSLSGPGGLQRLHVRFIVV